MSNLLIASFILVATLVAFSMQKFNAKSPEILEPNFLHMMLNSRSSPEVTMQCFQNYNSNLEKVSLKYEKELNGCNETATNATKAVDQEVDPNVTAVQESQKNICTGFSKCSSLNSGAYDFFDCSNEAAGDTLSEAYNIQSISRDKMKYIAMKQQIIKYDHDTCTDKCKATYNEDAVQIYVELQDCLAGKIVVTTTTTIPTTTTASTTTVIYYSTTTDSYDEH